MNVLLRMMRDMHAREALAQEHAHWTEVLTQRANALDVALRAERLVGAPWDGGFFVTIELADAQGVCERLAVQDVFVVPMPEGLRVGICGLRASDATRFAAVLASVLREN